MNALIKDSLSKHSDINVKVAVASCISEITRTTAPNAPYTDDQMMDLSDRSSRSYNKRASILETVSKVKQLT
ncbi:putative sister chromatid cohesion protein Pds5 [Helianthus anomalus]